ncbi:MAG: hypothetical protein WDW36_004631 [Sanguina aurantia]
MRPASSRAISRNSSLSAKGSGGDALRTASLQVIDDQTIKIATQRFDVDIVFKLQLSGRGLSCISGLKGCINLLELNLSGNTITSLAGLGCLPQLRTLILSTNLISSLDTHLTNLSKLESLHLQDNRISDLESLCDPMGLRPLTSLRALYLQNLDRTLPNPVCGQPRYKARLLGELPALTNLDGERSPSRSSYMELSAESVYLSTHTAPPRPLIIPDIPAWSDPEAAAVAAALQAPVAAAAAQLLQDGVTSMVKVLDECQVLNEVLGSEISKAQAV